MKNSNLKETFKEYSEFVPKELQTEINNSNAIALLGMYISLSISNHSNFAKVTNEQIKKTFQWENNQIQRANSKLESMKLISREISTMRGVPTVVTVLFKEVQTEKPKVIETSNNPMPTAKDSNTPMIETLIREIESLKKELQSLRDENEKLKEGMRILNKNFKEIISTLQESKNNPSTENTPRTSGNTSGIAENTSMVETLTQAARTRSGGVKTLLSKIGTRGGAEGINIERLERWFKVYNEGIVTLPPQFNKINIDKNINKTIARCGLDFIESVALTVTIYQDRLKPEHNITSTPNKFLNIANTTFNCNMWNELNLNKKARTYIKLYNETANSNVPIQQEKIEYEDSIEFDRILSNNFQARLAS